MRDISRINFGGIKHHHMNPVGTRKISAGERKSSKLVAVTPKYRAGKS